MIRETVVTTRAAGHGAHIAPMGIREQGEYIVLAPFRPSRTLDNVLREGCAVVNYVDDVRIIAGCLTGRYDWPTVPAERIDGIRLREALAHSELVLEEVEEEAQRPRLVCRVVHEAGHRPFRGFNRAQFSVLEAAILVSRLHLLPAEKIERELAYLRIGLEKTAGPVEREAWDWLMDKVAAHRADRAKERAL